MYTIFCLFQFFFALQSQLLKSQNFWIQIENPQILKDYFKEGLTVKELFEGPNKGFYETEFYLNTLPTGTDGCKKYQDFELPKDQKHAILLEETDFCSISVRAAHAYDAGIKMIFIKNTSDDLDYLVTDKSQIIRGINIPIVFVWKTDGQFLMDYLNQEDESKIEKVVLKITHENQLHNKQNKLVIVTHAYAKDNEIIPFLNDFSQNYQHAFAKYQVEILFTVRQDTQAKSENFLKQHQGCLGGGRYCMYQNVNGSNLLVYHTLWMICIRDIYSNNVLIEALNIISNKIKAEKLSINQLDNLHQQYGISAIKELGLDERWVNSCMDSSFYSVDSKSKADPQLDPNTLLQKEQQRVQELPVHSSIPMILINGIVFDGFVKSQLFIQFCCENDMIDCKSNKQQKKIILLGMMILSLFFVFSVMLYCKKRLRSKYEHQINQKVNEAIQKYLTIEKL